MSIEAVIPEEQLDANEAGKAAADEFMFLVSTAQTDPASVCVTIKDSIRYAVKEYRVPCTFDSSISLRFSSWRDYRGDRDTNTLQYEIGYEDEVGGLLFEVPARLLSVIGIEIDPVAQEILGFFRKQYPSNI